MNGLRDSLYMPTLRALQERDVQSVPVLRMEVARRLQSGSPATVSEFGAHIKEYALLLESLLRSGDRDTLRYLRGFTWPTAQRAEIVDVLRLDGIHLANDLLDCHIAITPKSRCGCSLQIGLKFEGKIENLVALDRVGLRQVFSELPLWYEARDAASLELLVRGRCSCNLLKEGAVVSIKLLKPPSGRLRLEISHALGPRGVTTLDWGKLRS